MPHKEEKDGSKVTYQALFALSSKLNSANALTTSQSLSTCLSPSSPPPCTAINNLAAHCTSACNPIHLFFFTNANNGIDAGFWDGQRSGWVCLLERERQRREQKRAGQGVVEVEEGQERVRGEEVRGVEQKVQAADFCWRS